MSDSQNFIHILIAEDNEVSRELMAGILKTAGYQTSFAHDGESAIEVIKNKNIDLAFVDINMAPKGGLEFIKHIVARGLKIPTVIVTSDTSSDILVEASSLGVDQVLHKPLEPTRFLETTRRILKRHGHNLNAIFQERHETRHDHETLMNRAIELAKKNIETKRGGPFGAIVADQSGKILGEGTNGITSRVDPTAHAEVMAIRQAAEKLGRADLSDCILYCSSEPTMMGKALIISVGIPQVYYGLSHKDTGATRDVGKTGGTYQQLGKEAAMQVFQQWKDMPDSEKARLRD